MAQTVTQSMQSYMTRVFAWMSGALTLTGVTAFVVTQIPAVAEAVLANAGIIFGLFIVQIALVVALSGFIHKLSVEAAALCFWSYAALTGVSLSGLFFIYTMMSLASTFFVAAGMFGVMAVYGATTDVDLTRVGTYVYMALFGLIIMSLVNMFIGSPAVYYAVGAIGVIIFSALTAYDVQKLQQIAGRVESNELEADAMTKIAIFMALALYLDFLNLFLFLLRFMGTRKR